MRRVLSLACCLAFAHASDMATQSSLPQAVLSSLSSLSAIVVSELGDNIWFIAVIMAMRHDRWAVFTGAMVSVAAMHILSVYLGALCHLVPASLVHYLSIALFTLLGGKMLHEQSRMDDNEAEEELDEAEQEVSKRERAGQFGSKHGRSSSFSTVFLSTLSMTFLAEWGDRSQLTTVLLAARQDFYEVIVGGLLGHTLCTALAVIGGKLVVERICVRTVTTLGGLLFFAFALTSLINGQDD